MNIAHIAFIFELVTRPSGSVSPTDHLNRSKARSTKFIKYGKSAMTPTILIEPAIMLLARIAPIRNVPDPPMNIFAGNQFHFRNANRAPFNANSATADSAEP